MSQENLPKLSDLEAKQLSFEKTRYDYSIKMFEREATRKQNLETKAQLYLTFITAFLTAIYLSLPYLAVFQGFMHNNSVDQFWRIAISVFLISLGSALLFSLIVVLLAMKTQPYKSEYPVPTERILFSPDKGTEYEENNEASLLSFISQIAITAMQENAKYNNRKAQYLEVASFGIL